MSKIEIEQIPRAEDNDTASTSSLDNTTENTKINENNETIDYNREEEIRIKNIKNPSKENNSKYLLYGNDIKIMNPKYLGRTRAFFYHNNYPLIIIGPDCKLSIYILIIYYKIVIVCV